MAENESFFRKVVRFVANPATDWTELNSRQEDSKELELEKSELKAMIERKRRNDFVRKREFDMLRRVRREGLSPEQLQALGTSSRLDDSEARLPDAPAARPDGGVKAKIDEIEQQMVGDAGFSNTRGTRATGFGNALAEPSSFDGGQVPGRSPAHGVHKSGHMGAGTSAHTNGQTGTPGLAGSGGQSAGSGAGMGFAADDDERLPALPPLPVMNLPPAAAPSPVQMSGGLPPLAPLSAVSFDSPGQNATQPSRPREAAAGYSGQAHGSATSSATGGRTSGKTSGSAGGSMAQDNDHNDFGDNPFAVEVSEVVHDPELDEAVIAFANADFTQCEEALQRITAPGGARAQHAETWLVLFDLFRATGQQQRFESLALEYAQQFGWSAPQWYSLPKLVADAQAEEPIRTARHDASRGGHADSHGSSEVGWVSPAHLDIEAVARLRSQTLQMPLPWVFDWGQLQRIDAEAAMQLSMLMRLWSGQALELRWIGGERLFAVLQEAAPTGVRDADPAFWLTRLDALRLANRADQFDEAAIDYCVTYEVSPPSWEPTRCKVHISGTSLSTRAPDLSVVSEVSTSFLESGLGGDSQPGTEMAHVELSGQLIGDIGATVAKMQGELGSAPIISVSCARLIRVDFIAAGDLLNWVLAKRSDNRAVQFVDTHRLVALFFGAMGINEHAKVQVRKV